MTEGAVVVVARPDNPTPGNLAGRRGTVLRVREPNTEPTWCKTPPKQCEPFVLVKIENRPRWPGERAWYWEHELELTAS